MFVALRKDSIMFKVIQGGRAAHPTAHDVMKEAERRIAATGHAAFAEREIATGIAMPAEIRYLPMRIGYAARVIGAMEPVPMDYREDRYWPSRQPQFAAG